MRILVTGGAGYIGSHFCKAAHKKGHKVSVVDDLSTGNANFVKWGDFFEVSILEREKVRKICLDNKIEAVVHFAAKSLVAESVKKPELYEKINVEGTRSLIEACRDTPVRYFIFSSSASTYGQPDVEIIDEFSTQEPINPYGETKLECEQLLLSQSGFELAILRYFNVIGQSPDRDLFEDHVPETHLVPNIVKALKEKKTFNVFGDNYPTPDGTCVRDYVDVNDLAEVHLAALDYIVARGGPLISNVGRGKGESIRQVLEAFENVFGDIPDIQVKGRREGDPARLVASAHFYRSWCSLPLRSLEESLKNLKLPD